MIFAFAYSVMHGQILNKVKSKVDQRVDRKVDKTIDEGLDKAEGAAKAEKSTDEKNSNEVAPTTRGKPTYKAYQNYDFIAGDTILFEDHFLDDEDGEFPSHWKLGQGQGALNKVDGVLAFSLTEGNYAEAYPRMKTVDYLDKEFTIEFDYYPIYNGYTNAVTVIFKYINEHGSKANAYIHFYPDGHVETGYLPKNKLFKAQHPTDTKESFPEKWHHAALSYKNGQLKCYIDQYRVLTIPDLGIEPLEFGLGGYVRTSSSDVKDAPCIFTNVRAAKGSKAKTIGSKFTDSKIITHGITFDFGKAVIKPESMGTLNMIIKILNDNPELKFEVGGHASKTGTGAAATAVNQTLSEQRAEAVRTQLISMGIDASRLTTKGYGETQPIADNATPEGRANNQRVEFTKL